VLHVVVTTIEERPTIDPGVSARYYISQCKIGTMGKVAADVIASWVGGRSRSNEKVAPSRDDWE
jgi:hypothetical protein